MNDFLNYISYLLKENNGSDTDETILKSFQRLPPEEQLKIIKKAATNNNVKINREVKDIKIENQTKLVELKIWFVKTLFRFVMVVLAFTISTFIYWSDKDDLKFLILHMKDYVSILGTIVTGK